MSIEQKKMKKNGSNRKACEMCGEAAWVYCESDEANLCWKCDAKVHRANFLVTKHSRCLFCRTCNALTPWKATGSQLGQTLAFCHACSTHSCCESGGGQEVVEGQGENQTLLLPQSLSPQQNETTTSGGGIPFQLLNNHNRNHQYVEFIPSNSGTSIV